MSLSATLCCTVLMTIAIATMGAPLLNSEDHTLTKRDTECRRKTDQELKDQLLAQPPSILVSKLALLPYDVAGFEINNVGVIPEKLPIFSDKNSSECIHSTLDYDSNRFPQYLLVARVDDTADCESLLVNDDSRTVHVLKRTRECSNDTEVWEVREVSVRQIAHQS